jgi:hypothetical protein
VLRLLSLAVAAVLRAPMDRGLELTSQAFERRDSLRSTPVAGLLAFSAVDHVALRHPEE